MFRFLILLAVIVSAPLCAQPVITVAGGPLAFGSVWVGNPSPERTFTVSGTGLTADITVTAPASIELAVVTGGPYTASVNQVPSGGVVGTTTVFARVKATAPAGMLTADITASSTGAANETVPVTAAVTIMNATGSWEAEPDETCSTSRGHGLGMLPAALAVFAVALRTRRREAR